MYHPPHWSVFWPLYPVTTILFLCNTVIFATIKLGIISPFIIYPQLINLSAIFGHFTHLEIWHFAFNTLALLFVGPFVEGILKRWIYIFCILLIWIGLITAGYFLLTNPSLGFSGILMGILSIAYFLSDKRDPWLHKNLAIWLSINVVIGLLPGISFLMHAAGMIIGGIIGYVVKK